MASINLSNVENRRKGPASEAEAAVNNVSSEAPTAMLGATK
jgi:hypothetical protein